MMIMMQIEPRQFSRAIAEDAGVPELRNIENYPARVRKAKKKAEEIRKETAVRR